LHLSKYFNWGNARLGDAEDFVLKFSLDTVTGKASLTGNQGVEEVSVFAVADGLTFIETLPTGAIQTTTVTKNGSSVHSRHTIIAGDLAPSQYFGQCKGHP
jgi:hypothetical protein